VSKKCQQYFKTTTATTRNLLTELSNMSIWQENMWKKQQQQEYPNPQQQRQ